MADEELKWGKLRWPTPRKLLKRYRNRFLNPAEPYRILFAYDSIRDFEIDPVVVHQELCNMLRDKECLPESLARDASDQSLSKLRSTALIARAKQALSFLEAGHPKYDPQDLKQILLSAASSIPVDISLFITADKEHLTELLLANITAKAYTNLFHNKLEHAKGIKWEAGEKSRAFIESLASCANSAGANLSVSLEDDFFLKEIIHTAYIPEGVANMLKEAKIVMPKNVSLMIRPAQVVKEEKAS